MTLHDFWHLVGWVSPVALVFYVLYHIPQWCESIASKREQRRHQQQLEIADRMVRQYCSDGPGSERRIVLRQSDLAQQDSALLDSNRNAAHHGLTRVDFISEPPPRAAGFHPRRVQ